MASHSEEPISPVGGRKPELVITSAPVNNEPVELDGTPTASIKPRRNSLEDLSPEERERRERLIHERKADPAVLVDIPQTPGPEELEKSGATVEGTEVKT